jgi:hypothetical protein
MTRAILDKETCLLWIIYTVEHIAVDQCTSICQRITFSREDDTEMYPASA